jgi:hypothetical protein
VGAAGADGLVKLWTIRTNECINTFDDHTDKVRGYVALDLPTSADEVEMLQFVLDDGICQEPPCAPLRDSMRTRIGTLHANKIAARQYLTSCINIHLQQIEP